MDDAEQVSQGKRGDTSHIASWLGDEEANASGARASWSPTELP